MEVVLNLTTSLIWEAHQNTQVRKNSIAHPYLRNDSFSPLRLVTRIRSASIDDEGAILGVHQSAFMEDERGEVSQLASRLLKERTSPQTISLVAESEQDIVGHIAFSPVSLADSKDTLAYLLSPLGVKADAQKTGIGTRLVESGKQILKDQGIHLLFVYGDPSFYGKFNFNAKGAERFLPPYELKYPFGWQLCIVNDCVIPESSSALSLVQPLCDPKLW